jgi:hypothetical protein
MMPWIQVEPVDFVLVWHALRYFTRRTVLWNTTDCVEDVENIQLFEM